MNLTQVTWRLWWRQVWNYFFIATCLTKFTWYGTCRKWDINSVALLCLINFIRVTWHSWWRHLWNHFFRVYKSNKVLIFAVHLELEISNLVLISCSVCTLYTGHVAAMMTLSINFLCLAYDTIATKFESCGTCRTQDIKSGSHFYAVYNVYPDHVTIMMISLRKFCCRDYNLQTSFNLVTLTKKWIWHQS